MNRLCSALVGFGLLGSAVVACADIPIPIELFNGGFYRDASNTFNPTGWNVSAIGFVYDVPIIGQGVKGFWLYQPGTIEQNSSSLLGTGAVAPTINAGKVYSLDFWWGTTDVSSSNPWASSGESQPSDITMTLGNSSPTFTEEAFRYDGTAVLWTEFLATFSPTQSGPMDLSVTANPIPGNGGGYHGFTTAAVPGPHPAAICIALGGSSLLLRRRKRG